MTLRIVEGSPTELYKEVASIVQKCFEGVWTAEDLLEMIEIPQEEKTFLVAYDGEQPIGYAYIVVEYSEGLDAKVATIQEWGMLPDFRDSAVTSDFLKKAIKFSKAKKAAFIEQTVSSLDRWAIPALISKKFKPNAIKADREISTINEAKLLFMKLKETKLNVLINELIFATKEEFEVQLIENEYEFDDIKKDNPIAFSSIITVDNEADLDLFLEELNSLDVEWDEIGITFEYILGKNSSEKEQ